MDLWSYFNISGGYFEPVTSRWSVRVEVLEDSFRTVHSLHGRVSSKLSNINMSLYTDVNFTENGSGNHSNFSYPGSRLPYIVRSPDFSAIFILLYTITTLVAILGNITAIIVFIKGKRSKTDLRPFLLNLAIADLIMAIFCIPFTFTSELLGKWVFSVPMCPIVVFLQTVSVTASVSTNMAIGIDRFNAIAFPLKTRITSSKYKIVIIVIWIFAISLSGIQLKVCRAKRQYGTGMLECNEFWEDEDLRYAYTLIILFLTYIIPLTILTITYSIVGSILWRRNAPGNADVVRDQMQLKAKMKVVKMLVTIVTFFGLCWLPLHTFFLVLDFVIKKSKRIEEIQDTLETVYFFAHWLAMSNSFVNPLIYGFMNENFRTDLSAIMFQICPFFRTSTRLRHRVVKKRSRGNDGCHTISTDYQLRKGLLERSRTEVCKNGHAKKEKVSKSPSAKSF